MFKVKVVDIKEVIGSRTEGQKDNGQNKIDKGTHNDLQALQKDRKTMDKTK